MFTAFFLIILIVMSTYDWKTGEIPLPLPALAYVTRMAGAVLEPKSTEEEIICLIAGAFLFLLFLLSAMFFHSGGGDALAAGLIGLYGGVLGVYAVLAGLLFSIPVSVLKKPFPWVPFLTAGYGFVLGFQIILKI